VVVVDTDFGAVMDAEADMVVEQYAGQVFFVDFRWVVQDLKRRTSHMDLELRIVVPHKLVEVGNRTNMNSVPYRSGSYRTAKGPS
jgi:tetrahydromethanopterin S-methyltransferase subunit B